MKKRRKNPHPVTFGRLGGLVRSEARRRANRENGSKGGLVKSRKKENCCPAKRPTPAAGEAPEEGVSAAIASIRALFGYRVIGLGYGGIHYLTSALR
jgi:hypothetical protein